MNATTIPTTPWEQLRDDSLTAMTPAERAEYDAAAVQAEARLQLAELVYNARTVAGLSQTELARRAGTRQCVQHAQRGHGHGPGRSARHRLHP
jgi:ribosome-binding protein aMBF1 (putative translation factor)